MPISEWMSEEQEVCTHNRIFSATKSNILSFVATWMEQEDIG